MTLRLQIGVRMTTAPLDRWVPHESHISRVRLLWVQYPVGGIIISKSTYFTCTDVNVSYFSGGSILQCYIQHIRNRAIAWQTGRQLHPRQLPSAPRGNRAVDGVVDVSSSSLPQVIVDVPRTAPEVPFFAQAQLQKSLERILFLWGIRYHFALLSHCSQYFILHLLMSPGVIEILRSVGGINQ